MNLLVNETSHYLLQHAQNPVHWLPWSEAAFEKARAENKPILLSIGYSSCHWCHVMAHESFEDEEVATLMNKLFVNIKLDREEYPDIDHFYMDAVQAMTGSGGWPLNVFLTPEKKPFYGGTYFPPKRMFNRASWKEILINVSQYFTQNRDQVEQQAEQLMQHVQQASIAPGASVAAAAQDRDKMEADQQIFETIMKTADREEGGFGQAPKFPSTFVIRFLLDYYALYQDETALRQACLSLDKMGLGGIYDQIGGGFARYSTDRYWIAPHFEKMLYDNALLIEVYSMAWVHTRDDLYRLIVEQTIAWLQREMMSEDFAFYAAQDADSEGVEGKFYTWALAELREVLQDDFDLFQKYYQLSEEGNWEHTNILLSSRDRREQLAENELVKLAELNLRLRSHRDQRPRPLTDDKIILSWNALMNKALSLAAIIFDRDDYLELAERNMQFILQHMKNEKTLFYHTGSRGNFKIAAYLDDLVFLSAALLQLNTAGADASYLHHAVKIADFVIKNFKAGNSDLFAFCHRDFEQVDVRKIEIYDGALPSPNSVFCKVLFQLGYLFHRFDWTERAQTMAETLRPLLMKYPTSFGYWANIFLQHSPQHSDISVIGSEAKKFIRSFYNKKYVSAVTYTAVNTNEENIEELRGKYAEGETRIYICKNQHCLSPFTSTEEAMTVIYPEKF